MQRIYFWLMAVVLCTPACQKHVINVPAPEGIAILPRVGNVQIIFDFNGNKNITVKNENARAVGVYVVKDNQEDVVLFSDAYIGATKSSTQSGVHFAYGWELRVTVVKYKEAVDAFASFLDALGSGFLDKLDDFWIEVRYEQVVVIMKS